MFQYFVRSLFFKNLNSNRQISKTYICKLRREWPYVDTNRREPIWRSRWDSTDVFGWSKISTLCNIVTNAS